MTSQDKRDLADKLVARLQKRCENRHPINGRSRCPSQGGILTAVDECQPCKDAMLVQSLAATALRASEVTEAPAVDEVLIAGFRVSCEDEAAITYPGGSLLAAQMRTAMLYGFDFAAKRIPLALEAAAQQPGEKGGA